MQVDAPTWSLKQSCPCCGQGGPALLACRTCGALAAECHEVGTFFRKRRGRSALLSIAFTPLQRLRRASGCRRLRQRRRLRLKVPDSRKRTSNEGVRPNKSLGAHAWEIKCQVHTAARAALSSTVRALPCVEDSAQDCSLPYLWQRL